MAGNMAGIANNQEVIAPHPMVGQYQWGNT
jgi:hypothetical protein